MFKKLFPIILLSILLLSLSSCDGGNDDEPRVPSITGISPSGWVTNAVDFLIIVTGQDFTSDSVILFDNVPLGTNYVNATTLNAVVPNSLAKQTTTSLGDRQIFVKVQNSVGTSEQRAFTFYENWNFPAPSNVNSGEPVIGLDMTMTQSSNGTLYAAWSHLIYTSTSKLGANITGLEVRFSRSDNGGASWTAPQKINGNLSMTPFDYPAPQIAIGVDNTLYILFSRNDPEKHYDFSWMTTSNDSGNTWSEPALLSPPSTNYAAKSEYSPSLYIEPVTKNIHNTWSVMTYGFQNAIYYTHSLYQSSGESGGLSETFSEPVRISNYTIAMQGESTVAANNTGDVHVVWFQPFTKDYYTKELWVNSSTNWGNSFSGAICIADKTQINQYWPMQNITVDPQGNVFIVYVGPFNGTISDIMFQKSTDHGAAYSSPVSLTSSTGTCLKPFIAADSQGNLVLIYQSVINDTATIYSRRSTDGGNTFSAPIVVGTVNLAPAYGNAFKKPPFAALDFYPRTAPMARVFMTMMNKPLIVLGNYHSTILHQEYEEEFELYSLQFTLGTGER